MKQLQQDVMCALLRILLDKGLISQDIHEQARAKILSTGDWPEFWGEGKHGGA